MNAVTCPGRDRLQAYVLGALPEQDAGQVEEHIGACAQCAAALETFDDLADTVIAGLREPDPDPQFLAEPEFEEARGRLHRLNPGLAGGRPSSPGTAVRELPERLGDYQILDRLGRGGMGAVYRARHLRLGKTVALKVLPKERLQKPEAKARFDREMLAIGQLDHPNVVRALDGREIDGQPVLVMEFVDGIDLAKVVERIGPLPVPEACELARQAALGLQFIHQQGLVHRDIKPSNLMLTVPQSPAGGRAPGRAGVDALVKILDLGLARLDAGLQPDGDLTSEGRAMGTADYISPEQALDSHQVDIRSDLYSLGCTLYKLLAGRAPFEGPGYRESAQKLAGHLRDRPTPVRDLRPDVPERLAAVLDRLLAKEPADRYDLPEDAADSLAPFAQGAALAALAQRAKSTAASPRKPAPRGASADAPTGPFHSSPDVGTDADRLAALPRPTAAGRPPWLRWPKLAAALAPLALALVLGVIVVVRFRDGREVALDVPDQYQARIDAERGTVEVGPRDQAPAAAKKAEAPPAGTLLHHPAAIVPKVAPPLRLVWQKEFTRAFENRISGVRLTADQKHLAVFHFTNSPLAPVEMLEARTGRVLWERAVRLKGRCASTGWIDAQDHLYLGSCWGGHTLWKTDPQLNRELWSYTGAEGFEYVLGIVTDAQGNVYASGYTGSFFPRGSRAVKLDPAGKLLWERLSLHGRGTDQYCAMALDSRGNLFRAGSDNTDPDRSAHNLGRILGHAAGDGREILNKPLDHPNSAVAGIAVDADDNLLVACTLDCWGPDNEPSGKRRTVVEKRDRQGGLLWQCPIPGDDVWAGGQNALLRRREGGFLLSYEDRRDGKTCPALAEVSSEGKLRWTARIEAPGWDYHLSSVESDGARLYLGLTNSDDGKQTQVLALEAPRAE